MIKSIIGILLLSFVLSVGFSCTGLIQLTDFTVEAEHCNGHSHCNNEQDQGNEEEHESNCNPFCSCGCCLVSVDFYAFTSFEHLLQAYAINLIEEQTDTPVLIPLSIWHPPRA